MTKAGEISGQQKRFKGNLKTKDNQIPVLSGTSKDHKIAEDENLGPDVRPIMGAMVGPNVGLANYGSIIIRAIANEFDVGNVSKSTEETIAKIEEYNKNREILNAEIVKEDSTVIIGSMDIDKWYPNTQPKPSAKNIREMYELSSAEIATIDYDVVSKYLGEFLTEEEIKEEGFEDIVYRKIRKEKKVSKKNKKVVTKNVARKNVKNKNVQKEAIKTQDKYNKNSGDVTSAFDDEHGNKAHKIVGGMKVNSNNTSISAINDEGNIDKTIINEISDKGNKEGTNISEINDAGKVTLADDDEHEIAAHKTYTEPRRKPTPLEQRRMFGKCIEILIKTGMQNHVYRFHNKIRRQKSGGPIGLALTGEVADCFMLNWDEKFKEKLKSLGFSLLLYSRLKDDILISTNSVKKGTKYENGNLVKDASKEIEDVHKTDTKITMEVLQDVANSVDNMITFTHDTPCNYPDKKMPALDIKVNVNQEMKSRIDYEFFEKPTKNPRVLLASSAISSASKRTILTQECMRRMRNTKVELGEKCRNQHLNNFMVKLKNSGYNEKYRTEILDSACKGFEKMLEDDKNGVKPLFRNREWNKDEREENKRARKLNWYKNPKDPKINYKSVLFVPPTPGGVLARNLKTREQEINRFSQERIKIIEKSGQNIENILVKKDPFQKGNCTEKKCPICQNPDKKSNVFCNTNNVGYKWTCSTCRNRDKTKVYEGETSRSARLRGKEHLDAYRRKDSDSVLYKHKLVEHEQEDVDFVMEITGVFRDALTRQADEAVRIYTRKNEELMNSKSEFNHPPIARVVVQKTHKQIKGTKKLVRPGV